MLSNLISSLLETSHNRNQEFKSWHIDPYLKGVLKHCRNYHVHVDARELVPISEIIEENLDILDDVAQYQDNLLPLIVDWFKTKFFAWFEAPECEKCRGRLEASNTYVNLEHRTVEVYKCPNEVCDYKFEFIRHNDPAILLHTRTGRCGEWGICFFIILRALDYDARIVYDSTDHVWNEVWSEKKQRWIHVDPCEGLVDSPLLYEAGWKKKLVYCLAYHEYEVLDVTARYVCNHALTLALRELCEEQWLREHLDTITESLLSEAPSDEVRNRVRSRRSMDKEHLQKLAAAPQVAPSNLHGRRTGGIQWRLERGEYSLSSKTRTTIRVDAKECNSDDGPIFKFVYDCDGDLYECSDDCYNSKGWASLVYAYENIDHKYERDWKTSYLARYETCPASKEGLVKWKFDLSELKGRWERFELFVGGKVYSGTTVDLKLDKYESGDSEEPTETIQLELNEAKVIERNSHNVEAIGLTATLSGGSESDAVAWQKPQLFRHTRGQKAHECCLSIKIV